MPEKKESIEKADAPVIPDELKKYVGVDLKKHLFEVENGHLRRYYEAIGNTDPIWLNKFPATLLLTVGIGQAMDEIRWALDKSRLRRIFNAGNEIEYYQPINVGDVIAHTGKLVDVYEKEGKIGKMLFWIIEVTYRNQKAEIVAKGRYTFIRH
jgi:hypothetical protein